MAKKKAKKPESFESALEELAGIVNDLEDSSIGLDDSLARFEEGMRLLRHCHEVLEKAEQRIEQLTGIDADGNPVTQPLDSSATIEQRQGSAGRRPRKPRRASSADDDDDDGPRLF